MGIMNLFVSSSQWIATIAMGWILDSIGFKYFFPISSVIMFVAAIVIFFSRFENTKREKESKVR